MLILIRNLFEQVLKTNENLQFAVLTGCMRISKESIFTGLNNLKVLSIADVEKRFTEYLRKTISIRDAFVKNPMKENFYHGILLGLLGYQDIWCISSNKESGDGYSDILVEIDDGVMGIVIEVKDLEDGIECILKYGIACYKKRCKVMLGF